MVTSLLNWDVLVTSNVPSMVVLSRVVIPVTSRLDCINVLPASVLSYVLSKALILGVRTYIISAESSLASCSLRASPTVG